MDLRSFSGFLSIELESRILDHPLIVNSSNTDAIYGLKQALRRPGRTDEVAGSQVQP
jgi:hypothetical protein